MEINRITELTDFIEQSPTAFHAVQNLKTMLDKDGFQELKEAEKWHLEPDGKYYVTRNNSSIIALKIGNALDEYSFHVTASHSDSPTFKLKENIEINVAGKYTVLNTEGYGGMICSTWFDRPLSVAGRLLVKSEEGVTVKLVQIDKDLLMLPSLAIHMNRDINTGYDYHAQKDMLPLYGMGTKGEKESFMDRIAREADVKKEDILGSDLYVYNRMPGSVWGSEDEFMSIGKLDDLECVYSSMTSFLSAEEQDRIPVHCVYDNEEVGSGTKQGAGSPILRTIIERIVFGLGGKPEDLYRAIHNSFMISADMAHALHPNYVEKHDPTNHPVINGGPVIKINANQKYITDGDSAAVFKTICKMAGVPCQEFVNHSDMAGGSTLGNILLSQMEMRGVDIGNPMWAMHSVRETGGVLDHAYVIKAFTTFYNI